ncbi:MFS transporter [Jiangella gansuensis]|uniref:MFS transporter n=1 Tax=Jiangella gansuensis TaxID=281473 RepID=UPI00047AF850|nr:MFS transporter [Jiangella gansuensis]
MSRTTEPLAAAREPEPEPGQDRWPAVAIAALATFTVVAAEMMPVGLLTPIGSALGESEGTVGLSLTLTGLAAAVTAPLVPVVIGRADRRTVLVALMVALSLANALTALAPTFPVMAVARVLLGVTMGAVWALAAGLAPRLVRERSAGLATTVVFSGIAVASVLGVPVGTYLGAAAGWRAAFWALAALGLLVAAAMAVCFPALPGARGLRLRGVPGLLRIPAVTTGLVLTALLVTGHFAAYTYVRPVLETFGGIGAATLGTLLVVYGVFGVAGNFAAGPRAARRPRRVVVVLAGTLLVSLATVPWLGTTAFGAGALLAVWGLAYGGVSVSTQAWMARAAPRELGTALWVGVFNASIAAGAFAGGAMFDAHGARAVVWTAAGLVALALVTGTLTRLPGRPR